MSAQFPKKPQRILLTGARGMVGRNLLEHPKAVEYQWLTPTRNDLDLTDRQAVQRYLEAQQPDFILHAAGKVGGIQANMADPVGFLVENTRMADALIMGAYQVGISRLLNLASSCMYPKNVETLLTEDQLLTGPLEPTNEGYALAKIWATRLCQAISQQSPEFAYKTLIPCNLYGRWDHYDAQKGHMIPAVIQRVHGLVQQGASVVEMWGDGTARREFMACTDLAHCVFQALERFDTLPSLANVGLGEDYTVEQYYEAICQALGFEGRFEYNLDKPVGMKRKVVSVERIRAWGWKAQTSLADGIAQAVSFYRHQVLGLGERSQQSPVLSKTGDL